MLDLFGNQTGGGHVSAAILSPCSLYRYRLSRTWDENKPPVTFVMLNPSTADATRDDPTIRRCKAFARAWGCGSLRVVNLFAFRATDPSELSQATDAVGPDNDAHIIETAGTGLTVAAWGAHTFAATRARCVLGILAAAGVQLQCLGLTRSGHPRHPLYAPGGSRLIPFPPATEG